MKALALTSAKAESAINAWLNRENTIMSEIHEGTLTNRQCILLANAAISFIALTGVGAGIPSLLIRLGWFIYSVNMCKKGGIK
jgi:hypothetical protein